MAVTAAAVVVTEQIPRRPRERILEIPTVTDSGRLPASARYTYAARYTRRSATLGHDETIQKLSRKTHARNYTHIFQRFCKILRFLFIYLEIFFRLAKVLTIILRIFVIPTGVPTFTSLKRPPHSRDRTVVAFKDVLFLACLPLKTIMFKRCYTITVNDSRKSLRKTGFTCQHGNGRMKPCVTHEDFSRIVLKEHLKKSCMTL